MMALEMLGANPPFPLYQAFVPQAPTALLLKGLPRYAVVGVAVSQDDPREPESMVRLIVSARLNAVNDFNAQNKTRSFVWECCPATWSLDTWTLSWRFRSSATCLRRPSRDLPAKSTQN